MKKCLSRARLLLMAALFVLFSTACGKTETPPCRHVESDWIVDRVATTEAAGEQHKECMRCGEVLQTESLPQLPLTQEAIFERLAPSMVEVICYEADGETEMARGSGFFIDDKGTFVTNAHVVKECSYIKIRTHLGVVYDVNMLFVCKALVSDHAVCRATACTSSEGVTFAATAAEGDTVYAIGFPGKNDALVITSGVITEDAVFSGRREYYGNTAPIAPGSSGGVLVNVYGQVLGITTGVHHDDAYIALKYSAFQSDVEASHTDGPSPLEYFHPTK